ncbi:hypothetical protein C2G38_2225407 [Gigaspora rosea]|uniref:Uncharacterized protein n=1 Tax=Gigaspora rosea TaxID=44941 RepID=A0A397TZA1_9GLOM|nr:hypothetical protein C2G38_2225407 [Gigaspora rosea]
MYKASTTDSIYESGNIENFFNAYDFGNPESFCDAFDSSNPETFFNMFEPGNMEDFFEPINDKRNNEAIQHTKNPQELEKLDKWFNSYRLENGFVFTITHSEKDKEDAISSAIPINVQKIDHMYLEKKCMLLRIIIAVTIPLAAHFMLIYIDAKK